MIVDTLNNRKLYMGLSSRMDTAFDWIAETVPETLRPGEYPVCDGVRAIIEEYTTIQEKDNKNKYEAHRKYIDIQYVVYGTEIMLVRSINGLQTDTSYDDEKDIIFFHSSGIGSHIVIADGMFAVYFPQDAHIPGLAVDSPAKVLKIVVKVAV